MEKKDLLARYFGTMSLLVLIWTWISAVYYFAEMIGYSLESIGLYLWGIGLVLSAFVWWKYRAKWLQIWYVLKPSVLRLLIFVWHLFTYFCTRNLLYNLVVAIIFTFYTLRRCEKMGLRGLDIGDELDRILKWNNNAFYMTSIFFLWFYIRMSNIVEIVMAIIDMEYVVSLLALVFAFIIAVFGFVRFQYVICVNIAHVMLNRAK